MILSFAIILAFCLSLITADTTGHNWRAVTSDATGQYLAAVYYTTNSAKSYVQLSDDYGKTWYASNSIAMPWYSIDSDSTGQILVAVADCPRYFDLCKAPQVTLDRGKTWIDGGFGYSHCMKGVVDTTGNYFASVCWQNGQYLSLLRSSNTQGKKWYVQETPYLSEKNTYESSTLITPLAAPMGSALAYLSESMVNIMRNSSDVSRSNIKNNDWNDFAISDSGDVVAAVAGKSSNGQFYSLAFILSIDGGKTYSVLDDSILFHCVAMDAKGKLIFATSSSNGIYIYNTETQQLSLTPAPFNSYLSIAVDATGQYVLAAGSGAGLFHSSDYGETWELL